MVTNKCNLISFMVVRTSLLPLKKITKIQSPSNRIFHELLCFQLCRKGRVSPDTFLCSGIHFSRAIIQIMFFLNILLDLLLSSTSCLLVGYHNGGLSLKDRNLIEGLFLNGDLQILCTTNTLAHGINLPAHTVVIKSTQHLYD